MIDYSVINWYITDVARPKSEEKLNAIMAAAIRVIVSRGLSAPTALIAQEAGVANGTLFTYFETKADLLNHLYLDLKTQMAVEASKGISEGLEPREQLFNSWKNWIGWATNNPEKRIVLAQLGVSDIITSETRAAAGEGMAKVDALLEQVRAKGPMSDAPKGLIAEIMVALTEATINHILRDPDNTESHCKMGFDAVWRVVGWS